MKEDYKKYVRTPPYTTKAGVQIGLLYREPFEVRVDRDAYELQGRILSKYDKSKTVHYGDRAVGIFSAVIFVAIILLEVFHVL